MVAYGCGYLSSIQYESDVAEMEGSPATATEVSWKDFCDDVNRVDAGMDPAEFKPSGRRRALEVPP